MMRLFDTHCHLNDERFSDDWMTLAEELPKKDVELVVNAGCDLESSYFGQMAASKFNNIYFSAGMHPHDAKDLTEDALSRIIQLCSDKKCVALGEIGLDYHYDYSPREVQRDGFARQLDVAKELDIPVIIHEREAWQDTIDIMKNYKGLRGVFHCFSGNRETAKICLDMGFYISFCGPLTFKNARNPIEVAQYIPRDRALIETDSPYMTPEPHRGKRNDPSNVFYIAQKLSLIWGTDIEMVAHQTFMNGCKLFDIQI